MRVKACVCVRVLFALCSSRVLLVSSCLRWAPVPVVFVFALCSLSWCVRSRCVRALVLVLVVWWCSGVVFVVVMCSHCARTCPVLALFVLVPVVYSRRARVYSVLALCLCLSCAHVVLVFVVCSRCACVCCFLTLRSSRGVLALSSCSWCARVELVLVMCSCCARTRDVLVLCSCSWCARVVSHLQNMHWPLGFASFPLVFLSLSANTPHCTHANAFAPIRSRPHLFWFFFVKHDVRGNFPGHWAQIMSFGPPNAPWFPFFCCALVPLHPTTSIKTHPHPFAPICSRPHPKL